MSSVVNRMEANHSAGHQTAGTSLWDAINQIATAEGVELFDLDMPGTGGGGVLRVYITRSKPATEAVVVKTVSDEGDDESPQRTGVSFEDCTRVSKRILDVDEETGLIPEGCLLEVSSPGINRRLRRAEHFQGAVGERVRVKYRSPENVYRVVTGLLKEANGDSMTIEAEEGKELVSCKLGDVKEARVDFKF